MPRNLLRDQARALVPVGIDPAKTEELIRDVMSGCAWCQESQTLLKRLQEEKDNLLSEPKGSWTSERAAISFAVEAGKAPVPTHPAPLGACQECVASRQECDKVEQEISAVTVPYCSKRNREFLRTPSPSPAEMPSAPKKKRKRVGFSQGLSEFEANDVNP